MTTMMLGNFQSAASPLRFINIQCVSQKWVNFGKL